MEPGRREEFLAAQVGLMFGGGDVWWVYGLDAETRVYTLGTAEAMLKTSGATLLGARFKEHLDLMVKTGQVKVG